MNKTATAILITLALIGTASFLYFRTYVDLNQDNLDIDLYGEESDYY